MSQGNFFALDRRAWAMVCALGMPSAAAYLVLGCFSGRDNRSTHASVHAVETYTAISRGRSRQAIEKLKAAGAIRQTASGAKPAYELLSVPEIPALAKDAPRCEEMTDSQRRIYELVQNGQQPSGRQRQSANSLVRKGWLSCDSDIFHLNEACEAWLKPDWIWLPKTIVTGAGNETPPVERARQTADVMTMRLFIDLYHAQNLREDGGVDRWCVFGRFERKKIGQRAQYDVWGFENMCLHARQTGPAECHYRAEGENRATDFFRRLDQLKGLGCGR